MKRWTQIEFVVLVMCIAGAAQAASQAKLHVAVYGAGFLVDTQRMVDYGDGVRRIDVSARAHGIAKGEIEDSYIGIDNLNSGMRLRLDPRSKTYTSEQYGPKALTDEAGSTKHPVTLKVSRLEPKVTGPIGSDTINGFPSQSYTIRVTVDFADMTTATVIATETLLEKVWVTTHAPAVEKFRQDETDFDNALYTRYGAEEANLRWLIRQFNQQVLSYNGSPDDYKKIIATYRTARAQVQGVTVRQIVAWKWEPKSASAPGADQDMSQFIVSLAAGLGAPPEAEEKTPLSDALRPYWATEMEKDFGRSGSMLVMLGEVLKASAGAPEASRFEVPTNYKKGGN